MSDRVILAGDIGGTKSNLAIFRGSPDSPELVVEQTYQNCSFSGLDDIVRRFHSETGLYTDAACFGVAGAITGGEIRLPNLSWRLSEKKLLANTDLRSVRFINDLEANAMGLPTLDARQLYVLNRGKPRSEGNQALIAAGTGLGMAAMVGNGMGHQVMPSEGGHADFAPRNEDEIELWRSLATRYGRVSVERVVSGPGLVSIYDFLSNNGMQVPNELELRLNRSSDHAATIAESAMNGENAICVKALELFLSAYGAAAGNLALTAFSTGGVYIGGGIAPKLIKAFPASGFMVAFIDKGRFSSLLADIPVSIILEPKTALRGAARAGLGGMQRIL